MRYFFFFFLLLEIPVKIPRHFRIFQTRDDNREQCVGMWRGESAAITKVKKKK